MNFCLVLVAAVFSTCLAFSSALQCFQCIDASSDEECTREGRFVTCDDNQESCETTVRYLGVNRQLINKRCKQPLACKNFQQSRENCASHSPDTFCSCCCFGFRCNTFVDDSCDVNRAAAQEPWTCADAPQQSAVYRIRPFADTTTFYAYCKLIGGKNHMVIQRRIDGKTNFFRNYTEYKQGFGEVNSEYWIGLENLYRLTNENQYQLRIDLIDWSGQHRFATYNLFKVGNASSSYKLKIGGYSGNAGDSMAYHNNRPFQTFDYDHRQGKVRYYHNCAQFYGGGWWYRTCYRANLNGLYHHQPNATARVGDRTGIVWEYWKGFDYSLNQVTMSLLLI